MIFILKATIQSNKIGIIISLLLIINSLSSCSQNSLEGQTYSAITSEACKLRVDGGCVIIGTCILEFEKDSVLVYYKSRGNCSPTDTRYDKDFVNPKKYSWSQTNGVIYISGFEDYGDYSIKGTSLIGSTTFDEIDSEIKFNLD